MVDVMKIHFIIKIGNFRSLNSNLSCHIWFHYTKRFTMTLRSLIVWMNISIQNQVHDQFCIHSNLIIDLPPDRFRNCLFLNCAQCVCYCFSFYLFVSLNKITQSRLSQHTTINATCSYERIEMRDWLRERKIHINLCTKYRCDQCDYSVFSRIWYFLFSVIRWQRDGTQLNSHR